MQKLKVSRSGELIATPIKSRGSKKNVGTLIGARITSKFNPKFFQTIMTNADHAKRGLVTPEASEDVDFLSEFITPEEYVEHVLAYVITDYALRNLHQKPAAVLNKIRSKLNLWSKVLKHGKTAKKSSSGIHVWPTTQKPYYYDEATGSAYYLDNDALIQVVQFRDGTFEWNNPIEVDDITSPKTNQIISDLRAAGSNGSPVEVGAVGSRESELAARWNNSKMMVKAKCNDAFYAKLADQHGIELGEMDWDYVPRWFPNPDVSHGGDYIEINIDVRTGRILNWVKPSLAELRKTFKPKA